MQAGGAQQQQGGYHPLWINTTPAKTDCTPDPSTLYQILGAQVTYSDGTPMSLKEAIMENLLRAKATQHMEVMRALLSTGANNIIENTAKAGYDDNFWGNGKNGGPARNALGKLWMKLRDEFTQVFSTGNTIPVSVGFPPELCLALGIQPSKIAEDTSKQITYLMVDPSQGQVWNKAADINANTPASWPALAADIDTMLLAQGIQAPAPVVQAAAYDPCKDPASGHYSVLNSLKSLQHGQDITMLKADKANDGSNRDVFKIYFKDPATAQQFALTHKRPADAAPPIKNHGTGAVVILGEAKVTFLTDASVVKKAISETKAMIHAPVTVPQAHNHPVAAMAAPAQVDPMTQVTQSLAVNFVGSNIVPAVDFTSRTFSMTVGSGNTGEITASLVAWQIPYNQIGNVISINEQEAKKWISDAFKISDDIFAAPVPAAAPALAAPPAPVAVAPLSIAGLPATPYDAAMLNLQAQYAQCTVSALPAYPPNMPLTPQDAARLHAPVYQQPYAQQQQYMTLYPAPQQVYTQQPIMSLYQTAVPQVQYTQYTASVPQQVYVQPGYYNAPAVQAPNVQYMNYQWNPYFYTRY